MTVDEIAAAILGKPLDQCHPDDVQHWRSIVYTVLVLARADLPPA